MLPRVALFTVTDPPHFVLILIFVFLTLSLVDDCCDLVIFSVASLSLVTLLAAAFRSRSW